MIIKIKRLGHGKGLPLPAKATEHSSCVDLVAAVNDELVMDPGKSYLVPTGLVIEVPVGYEAQVRPRSGLALKKSIGVLNSPGTIDSDYRGELGIILFNFGREPFVVRRGERIAQMTIVKTEGFELTEARGLSDTKRGSGGFGHTGV